MRAIQKAGLLKSIRHVVFVSVADAVEYARLSSAKAAGDVEAGSFKKPAVPA